MFELNKCNNTYKKLYRNEGGMGDNVPTLCRNQQNRVFIVQGPWHSSNTCLWGAGSMALFKHVIHYGPRSDLPYYNLGSHSHWEDSPFPPHEDALRTFTRTEVKLEDVNRKRTDNIIVKLNEKWTALVA
jgi:hypothetical protein